MQVALLCGGLGTRLSEHTALRPKPMVEIGDKPILWHLMRYYAHYGHKNFVLCAGYRSEIIKDFFLNLRRHHHDIRVDLATEKVEVLPGDDESLDWIVTIQDTGKSTQTGARLKRALNYIDDDVFMASYGDGLSDVALDQLADQFKKSGKLAAVTAVRPSSRFGELGLKGNSVTSFAEKPQTAQGWINGGFFVFHRSVFEELPDDPMIALEDGVLKPLADRGELSVFRHDGFWQCMDTQREMELLNDYWRNGIARWRVWT